MIDSEVPSDIKSRQQEMSARMIIFLMAVAWDGAGTPFVPRAGMAVCGPNGLRDAGSKESCGSVCVAAEITVSPEARIGEDAVSYMVYAVRKDVSLMVTAGGESQAAVRYRERKPYQFFKAQGWFMGLAVAGDLGVEQKRMYGDDPDVGDGERRIDEAPIPTRTKRVRIMKGEVTCCPTS